MNVAFRADASLSIGTGHVMRCLVLADALKARGARTAFLARDLHEGLAAEVRAAGHRLLALPALEPAAARARTASAAEPAFDWARDAEGSCGQLAQREPWDWLVADHYGIDARWEKAARRCATRIWVIDDLADRRHDCDALLDQGFDEDAAARYAGLVPPRCRLLLGPRFALLRKEILEARRRARPRDGRVRRLLVFFGGTDAGNHTALALEAARSAVPAQVQIDVVAGSGNPRLAALEAQCASMANARLHVQTRRMAELMEGADLALGAGGVAALERCAVGLPSIVAIVADNQRRGMQHLARQGAILLAGAQGEVSATAYAERLAYALGHPDAVRELAARASEVMQGCEAGTQACADEMERATAC
jgi:UDP-2,4-diacetamido-2,4,6-trideoxy-beta-L-altropyranose hydrolase